MSSLIESNNADSANDESLKNDDSLTPTGRKKVVWTKKRIVLVAFFVILVIISIAVLIMIIIDKTFLFEIIRDYFLAPLVRMGYWSIFLFLALMIIQSLIAPIPSELVLLCGGMLYGIWLGLLVGVIGSVLSGVVTFYIANKGGRPILEATGDHIGFADRFVIAMDKWIEKWGIWAIIVGRAVPVVMFDPISYAAGFSNINWKQYTLATFIGSIPRSIFYAFLGVKLLSGNAPEYLLTLTQEQFEAASGQFNLIFFIIFGVLILMLIIASIVGNRIKKKSEKVKLESKTDE
ncbi:MAG: TVP38/TMEM64 family protein [Candidatus Heimdallarchaeaceae archaeon]